MRNQIAILILWILVTMALCAGAEAQNVKGTATDESGKPIANATIELANDAGRKFTGTTNQKGEFVLKDVPEGKYNATLVVDGQPIETFLGYSVASRGENALTFDVAKDRQRAGANSEQVRKQQEAIRQNEKIKGLNQMLQQAAAARQAGDYPKAVAIMQAATQQDPSQDPLWISLGQSYLGAKQYPEAIEAFKKATVLKPDRHEYHNLLGVACLRNRQMDEAAAEFKTAAELNDKTPNDPKHNENAALYWYNDGAVLTNQGKTDEAVEALDKAIAADPNKADAYYQKGLNLIAKASVGKDGTMSAPEGTGEAFQKYLALSPNGQFAEPAKQMLAMIGAKVENQYGNMKTGKK